MRKRSFEALKARDRGRKALERPPGGALDTLDIAQRLRELHARIVGPTSSRPYWSVFALTGRFLGAGKTPGRAVAAATGRTYLDRRPSQGA